MDAWRTSCPRLSVWEDATADGLVELADAGLAERASKAAPQIIEEASRRSRVAMIFKV